MQGSKSKGYKEVQQSRFYIRRGPTCSEFDHLPGIFLPTQCELAQQRKRHSGRKFLYCHMHKLNLTQKISDYEIFMF